MIASTVQVQASKSKRILTELGPEHGVDKGWLNADIAAKVQELVAREADVLGCEGCEQRQACCGWSRFGKLVAVKAFAGVLFSRS